MRSTCKDSIGTFSGLFSCLRSSRSSLSFDIRQRLSLYYLQTFIIYSLLSSVIFHRHLPFLQLDSKFLKGGTLLSFSESCVSPSWVFVILQLMEKKVRIKSCLVLSKSYQFCRISLHRAILSVPPQIKCWNKWSIIYHRKRDYRLRFIFWVLILVILQLSFGPRLIEFSSAISFIKLGYCYLPFISKELPHINADE